MPTAKRVNVPKMPFAVPAPIESAIKTAAEKVEVVAGETKVAAAKLEKTVRAAATSVRETSATIARDPKGFVQTVVRDGRSLGKSLTARVETMKVDVGKEASRFADEVASRVSDMLDKSLHRMNVATRADVASLRRKIDLIDDKIDALHDTPARKAAPRPRAAKPRSAR